MNSFLISGIALLTYSLLLFRRNKMLYPSIVFSAMWGVACLFTYLAVSGVWTTFPLYDLYQFPHLETCIHHFAFASLGAFLLAHLLFPLRTSPQLTFQLPDLATLLGKYKWLLWLNFFLGLARIVLMVQMVGLDNMMDYRLATIAMNENATGFVGLVFRISNYTVLLSNLYISCLGLLHGLKRIVGKELLLFFLLFSTPQMATGGRLFILYFIIFYFGSFFLGRGIKLAREKAEWLTMNEKRLISGVFAGLIGLISLLLVVRGFGDSVEDKGKWYDGFTYITEGFLATENCMEYYPDGTYELGKGRNTFNGKYSDTFLAFRGSLATTRISSIVDSILIPLYLDYGKKGAVYVWFLIALICESVALLFLRRVSLIKFFLYVMITKIFYESVIFQSITVNLTFLELIVLMALAYPYIIGRYLENPDSDRRVTGC